MSNTIPFLVWGEGEDIDSSTTVEAQSPGHAAELYVAQAERHQCDFPVAAGRATMTVFVRIFVRIKRLDYPDADATPQILRFSVEGDQSPHYIARSLPR